MNFKKKAISPVVATSLLLIIAVIAVISFQNWFTFFSNSVFTNAEIKTQTPNSLKINSLIGNNLYLNANQNITIQSIKINGIDCHYNNSINQITGIDVSSCIENLSEKVEILVTTNQGILEHYDLIEKTNKILDKLPQNCPVLDGIQLNHTQKYTFYNATSGKTCHSEERTCTDGTLTGNSNYQFSNCTIKPAHLKTESQCRFKDNKTNCEDYYKKSGEVVTDTLLGLMWEQTPSFTGTKTWADAKSYCEGLTKAGHSDWRLPTIVEMETSLIDTSKSSPKIIGGNNNIFNGIQSNYYWTSTSYLGSYAYFVYFNNGYSDYYGKSSSRYVLCMRNQPVTQFDNLFKLTQSHSYENGIGQKRQASEFTTNGCGTGTIKDKITNLCWEKSPSTLTMNWANAKTHCTNKGSNWRLPDKSELMTLLYHNGNSQTHNWLNNQIGFSGIQNNYYWSNAEYSSSSAYFVNFYTGSSNGHVKSYGRYVLCMKTD